MVILHARDRMATPWKNGAGITRDVACDPPGATMATFRWRISLAEIQANVPFSQFLGIERTLTVVDGRGMTLTATSGETTEAPRDVPISFPGESAVVCQLYDGPVVAFNVMTRRGVAAASVEILAAPARIRHGARVVLVMALRDALVVAGRQLSPWDAIVLDGDAELAGVGTAAVVRIE